MQLLLIFWLLFCHLVLINPDNFAKERKPSRGLLEGEEEVLITFKQVNTNYFFALVVLIHEIAQKTR